MAGDSPDLVHAGEAERWGGWSWREPSRGEHFRTCSYCGSIHPEDLAAEANWAAEWADRKYGWPHKFYVSVPSRNPDQRFVTGATTGKDRPTYDGEWVRSDAIPEDVITDGWQDVAETYGWVVISTRPKHHAKFYTAHLADPGPDRQALETIQRVSGLRFTFEDGRVRWEPFTAGPQEGARG
ncbi:hypothetical protein [Streptomyces spinosirectus]